MKAKSAARAPQGRGAHLPYLPALDGLRALAVLAVILYHAGQRWLPGGFLGVEVFFVISGYLITSLLLAEWGTAGRVDLRSFWLRRARRLLPALFVLLLAVLAFAVAFLPGEVAGLRRDAAAAAGYSTNWYLVLSHQSYFESVGRPSLLRHLWSLAVEEQFYLLWPLLFVALLNWLRPRRALWAVLLGVTASTALMALLYNPEIDPSRVYYGTDTRAAGLLLGSALAFVWTPGRPHLADLLQRRAGGRVGPLLDLAGIAGIAVLIWACTALGEYQPLLYQGGFLLVSLATALVIAVVVHPGSRLLPKVFAWAPLRWVGVRSYGIYLWHWPILMLTRAHLDVPLAGLPLLALQLAGTVLAAELSYRFVETPVRTGALGRAWSALHEAHGARRRRLALRWAGGILAFAICFATLGQSVVRAQPPAPPVYLAIDSVQISASRSALTPPATPGAEPVIRLGAPASLPTHGSTQPPAAVSDDAAEIPVCLSPVAAKGVPGFTSWAAPELAGSPPSPSPALPADDWQLDMPDRVRPQPVPMTENLSADQLDSNEALTGAGSAPEATGMPGITTAAPAPAPVVAQTPVAVPALPQGPAGGPAPAQVSAASQAPVPIPSPTSAPAESPSVTASERVTAIGDSVMIAAAPAMQKAIPNLDLDARLGRQASEAIEILRQRRDAGQLGQVVVVHVGNNGTFTVKQIDALMSLLSVVRRVVIVNLKVPRSWEEADNTVLTEGVQRNPNAVLVDWHGASVDHPELFWDDGIHLRPEGAARYTELIAAAVKGE